MMGELFGTLMVYVLLIGAAVGLGILLGSRSENKKFVAWPVAAAVVLSVLSFFTSRGQQSPGAPAAAATSPAAAESAIHAEVMRQPVGPAARLKTDAASLKAMEEQEKALVAQKGQVAPADLSVTIELLPIKGDPVLLERGRLSGRLISSEILTIRGGELVAVNCTSSAVGVEPKLKSPVCAAEVAKSLGIDLATIPGDF
jgi:hypothetical protein